MKIYTCTPVAFHGNDFFFSRDSGLICRALQNWGVESKEIMPLPHYDDDQDDVLRVEYRQLESPDWWRSLGLDGLVFYSWAAPRYRKIARAIHLAGIYLVIHLDMSANLHSIRRGTLLSYARDAVVNFLRARHMAYADVLTCSLPVQQVLRKDAYYGTAIADKCVMIPTPIATRFVNHAEQKREKRVVCVGRWGKADENQKRPAFLLKTVQCLVEKDPSVMVDIYGKMGEAFQEQYSHLPDRIKERVQLKGFIQGELLPQVYSSSMVSLCPSRYEGTHLASLEALCCGCSVVTVPRPQTNVVQWYTSYDSGTVAKEDTPESLADAVVAELELWEKGGRDPERIGAFFQDMVHADKVVQRLFGHMRAHC